jgi:hypothetical protein
MNSFSDLFKKEHMGQLILVILLIIYLIMGYSTPEPIAAMIDTMGGKLIIFGIVGYLFMYTNPILAILGLFVAFDLIFRSSKAIGNGAYMKFAPSEDKKSNQFSAFNQFPYTLEQEMVKKMAPINQTGSTLTQASYKPVLDNTHEASQLY